MTLTFGYDNRSVVVDHDTLTFEEGYLQMGPYDPGHYKWEIWIEDYYPGFDGTNLFDSYATEDPPGDAHYSMFPNRYLVRDLNGVECEFNHGWEPWSWADGDVYFCVETYEEPIGGPGDEVDVFLVRSGSGVFQLFFAIGLILTLVGLLLLVLVRGERRKGLFQQRV
jgi:hypothetical protein